LALPLQYRVCGVECAEEAWLVGSGRTLNMSSSVVQFEHEGTLQVGLEVELFIAWPAKLNRSAGLTLRMKGHIVRTSQNCAVLRAASYEFHTRLHKRTS